MLTTLTVHLDALVANQLTSFCSRGRKAHAINDVVQTTFEQAQQILTR